jgi:hypothetical protein
LTKLLKSTSRLIDSDHKYHLIRSYLSLQFYVSSFKSGLLYSWPLIFSCLSCPTQFVREKYWTHLSNQGVKIHVREVQPQIFSFKTKNYNNYQEAKVNSVNKPGTCCFMFKMGGDLISLIPDPLAIVNWQWFTAMGGIFVPYIS